MSKKNRYDYAPSILKDFPLAVSTWQAKAVGLDLMYDKFVKIVENADIMLHSQDDRLRETTYSVIRHIVDNKLIKLARDDNVDFIMRWLLMYRWAKYKQIYNFDPDFAAELVKTGIEEIPYRALKRLPYNSFCIDCHDYYVIYHKSFDKNMAVGEHLSVSIVSENPNIPLWKDYETLTIPLCEEFKYVKTFEDLARAMGHKNKPEFIAKILKYLNLALYLVAEKPEIALNPNSKPRNADYSNFTFCGGYFLKKIPPTPPKRLLIYAFGREWVKTKSTTKS